MSLWAANTPTYAVVRATLSVDTLNPNRATLATARGEAERAADPMCWIGATRELVTTDFAADAYRAATHAI